MDKLSGKAKALWFVAAAAVIGFIKLLLNGLGSSLRKSDAKKESEEINKALESAKHAADLRAKIAQVKVAKIEADTAKEKARDPVDVANDILADLDGKK